MVLSSIVVMVFIVYHNGQSFSMLQSFIYRFRQQNRKIYLMDETWANKGYRHQHLWLQKADEKTIKSAGLAHCRGNAYIGGMNLPDSEGQRLIIVGFMSEDGIVKSTVNVFVGRKNARDYHEEMNGEHFEEYLPEQVVNELEAGSVVVMDKASYHSQFWDKGPESRNKADIIDWLVRKGEGQVEDLKMHTVYELLDMCKKYRTNTEYTVDRIFAAREIEVLRLPTKHCEYNPIEMV